MAVGPAMNITLREDGAYRIEAIDEHGNVLLTATRPGRPRGWYVGEAPNVVTRVIHRNEARKLLLFRAEAFTDPEKADAALAHGVPCKQCGAQPGEVCEGIGIGYKNPYFVHVGRLKDALPPPRDDRHRWLDWHDEFLADPQAAARHLAEATAQFEALR